METIGILQQISMEGNHDGIYSGLLPKAFNAVIEERSMKHYEDADAGTKVYRSSLHLASASPFLIIMNKNFYAFTNRISQLISTRMQLEIQATSTTERKSLNKLETFSFHCTFATLSLLGFLLPWPWRKS